MYSKPFASKGYEGSEEGIPGCGFMDFVVHRGP